MRTLCSSVLAMEAILVLLALPLVVGGIDAQWTTWAVGVGIAVMVLLIVSIGGLRRGWGVGLGWFLQIVLVASGVLVPLMFFLGGVFLALWLAAIVIGGRVDRRRVPPATP